MVEAVSTSATSVSFYRTTRRNIPEDSHLHIRCRENLKSHSVDVSLHHHVQNGFVFTQSLIQWEPGDLIPEIKRPELEDNQSPESGIER
jgi:hypothetical protein